MRTIVHLDADAFFASVEQAADSRLRCKAVAVGGEKRGIIASASAAFHRVGAAYSLGGRSTVLLRKSGRGCRISPEDTGKKSLSAEKTSGGAAFEGRIGGW